MTDTISKAITELNDREYNSAMQTDELIVERSHCKVKLIRKSPSLDHDEGFFIRVIPVKSTVHSEKRLIDYDKINQKLRDATGYTGDIDWDEENDTRVTFIPKE